MHQIDKPPPICSFYAEEVESMSGHSPMVSLRIPEDHLLALEQLVGVDGMRSRSDVIRAAVRAFLKQPHSGSMGATMDVQLGPDLTEKLELFCRISGDDADQVARAAIRGHMRREMADGALMGDLMRKRLDELRALERSREDHTP